MRFLAPLVLLMLATLAGCQATATAPQVYKMANQARYNAVRPWLDDYATLRPDRAQRVADVADSWEKEVESQRAATTQPVR